MIDIPRALSGPGSLLLNKVHAPMMSITQSYDRVSGYFGVESFRHVIKEIESIWENEGKVRLIISPANMGVLGKADQLIKKDIQNESNLKIFWKKEVAEIVSEIKNYGENSIQGLKHAIVNGHLEVNVAMPKPASVAGDKSRTPIFHSKFGIYHLQQDVTSYLQRRKHKKWSKRWRSNPPKSEPEVSRVPFVIFHGSVNESGQGWGVNIEDLSTHKSWIKGEAEVAFYFRNRFDELWTNNALDVTMIPLHDAIVEEIERIPNPIEQSPVVKIETYLQALSKIPVSSVFSHRLWLMPHQSRVVNFARTNSPVRMMLCDEVGLGKTLEALGILDYLLVFQKVMSPLLAVPASLMEQWAKAVNQFLQRRCFLIRKNTAELWIDGQFVETVDPNSIGNEIRLYSSHWVRRQDDATLSEIFSNSDILILDEAHHARCHDFGTKKGTKLFDLMYGLRAEIPHILLLTATPHQTTATDYLGLLSILTELEQNQLDHINDLQMLMNDELKFNHDMKTKLVKLLSDNMEVSRRLLPEEMYSELQHIDTNSLRERSLFATKWENELVSGLFYTTSIVTQSTIRHTRQMIADDFTFPDKHVHNVVIQLENMNLQERIRRFIIERQWNGFIKCLFFQRTASSLHAMKTSLQNRLNKSFLSNPDISQEANLEGTGTIEISTLGIEEKSRIENLIALIDETLTDVSQDPKIKEIIQIVTKHIEQKEKVLIFSRFTDTTEIVEQALHDSFDCGIGRFDGSHKRIRPRNETSTVLATKEELIEALDKDMLEIIVCSDAASEGLNLQSASVLVNVDVPWNPARLLQRIGRVDRLGQKNKEIHIYNLFYKGTIEEEMYRRLDQRHGDSISLLGDQPELFSTSESREFFKPDYLPKTKRPTPQQNESRNNAAKSLLELFQSTSPSSFLDALNEDDTFSVLPADKDFILRNPDILEKDIFLIPDEATIGNIVNEKGVPLALVLKKKEAYLPLHMTQIRELILGGALDEGWVSMEESVLHFDQDFGGQVQQEYAEISFSVNEILNSS